jgi:drug/metabolite transporter (DMT)-like permease
MSIIIPLLLMIISTLIGAVGALFLKRGAASFSLHPRNWLKQHHLMIGGTLYVLAILVYLVLLRYLPLSIAYPMTSISYVWILLLSAKYLGEEIDIWRWAGVFLIVTGVVLLTL